MIAERQATKTMKKNRGENLSLPLIHFVPND